MKGNITVATCGTVTDGPMDETIDNSSYKGLIAAFNKFSAILKLTWIRPCLADNSMHATMVNWTLVVSVEVKSLHW